VHSAFIWATEAIQASTVIADIRRYRHLSPLISVLCDVSYYTWANDISLFTNIDSSESHNYLKRPQILG
jgi:hypothetical protein